MFAIFCRVLKNVAIYAPQLPKIKGGGRRGAVFFLRDGFPEILELFAVFQFSLRWIFHGAGETIAY